MEKIQSFQVDHTRLLPGLYVSRTDGDAVTYDLRVKRPNTGDLLSNEQIHSFEHLFATFFRNSALGPKTLYFGPMGCQTGFYLVVRECGNEAVLRMIRNVLGQILLYSGPVFGASETECGNYRNLSLEAGKQVAREYLDVLTARPVTFHY